MADMLHIGKRLTDEQTRKTEATEARHTATPVTPIDTVMTGEEVKLVKPFHDECADKASKSTQFCGRDPSTIVTCMPVTPQRSRASIQRGSYDRQ